MNPIPVIANELLRNNITQVERIRQAARILKPEIPGSTIKGLTLNLDVEMARQREVRAKRYNRFHPQGIIPFLQRLTKTLIAMSERAIRERGLDVPTRWPGGIIRDRVGKIWLYAAEYQVHYSNSFGDWWTGAAYLCGVEHGQVWAVRVPRTMTTVREALSYIVPAAVRNAQGDGKLTLRQGDVWFVESRTDNLSDLPRSHRIEGEGVRRVVHQQHGTLDLGEGRWRVFRNKSVEGAGRGVD